VTSSERYLHTSYRRVLQLIIASHSSLRVVHTLLSVSSMLTLNKAHHRLDNGASPFSTRYCQPLYAI